MTRKLLFAAFLLTLALTFVAAHHQLTNAAPSMAPPPKNAPPLERYAASVSAPMTTSVPAWSVVAGGGGRDVSLLDVSMTSPTEGWAVGVTGPSSYGVIMHYTNTMWSRATVPTGTYAVDAVSMISSTEGWAAAWVGCETCDQRLLLHYTAGAGWQKVSPPASPGSGQCGGLRDIEIRGNVGWAVGAGCQDDYFLKFDGTNWSPVPALSYDATDVSMVSDSEAWAVGMNGPGTLARFSNDSWSTVTPTLPADTYYTYLSSVHMRAASDGWAVGWRRILPSQPISYRCLILRYDGNTWSQVACPPGLDEVRLGSVYARSSNDVWAVGLGPNGGSDGVMIHYDGSEWSQVPAPPGTPRLHSVKFFGDDGWVVGNGGTIFRFVNGEWVRVAGSSLLLTSLDSVSANEAWCGGPVDNLYQWKDGALVTHTSPVTTEIAALDMLSSTVGWAGTRSVAGNNYILRYDDGGWAVTPVISRVNQISAIGPDEAWFAMYTTSPLKGGVLHSHASSWEWQSVPGNALVNSVSMLDSNHGWATGYSSAWSKVYTYTDGVWGLITPTLTLTDTYGELKVIGISSDEAWVAGRSNTCTSIECPVYPQLHHFSGGAWTSVLVPDWLAFFDISQVNATEWWAAGKLKTMEYALLHYKDGTYTVVPAAGEDVVGVSMLPDGTGFARGAGSLLQLNIFTHQVYLPIVTR